ncbi:MAG: hypothetical protein J5662_07745 [Clostridia bacterium]|nr:hypothetical protein [Clostridia bacterium]
MDITKIDKNFKVETKIEKDDIVFLSANENPFAIYGVFFENGMYRRMPEVVAKTVSEGVFSLHKCTAGGRVVFKTDSPYIAISAKMPLLCPSSNFSLDGCSGFDLYERKDNGQVYLGTYQPPMDIKDGFESVIDVKGGEVREYVINLPLYSAVGELYIGLSDKSSVSEGKPYKTGKPIVYYGSSITQGGCASRPGNSYEAIISRNLNRDYINLGFSGNAKGEDEMANYIKDLPMSFFVYDYDHNAPSVEHLRATHERMFRIIREKNPDLPVLFLSRPKHRLNDAELERLQIIKNTYQNALDGGDRNVYFIPGNELIDDTLEDIATVDYCHPNDCGFYAMAQKIESVIKNVLDKG